MSKARVCGGGGSWLCALMYTCAVFAPSSHAATALDDYTIQQHARPMVVQILTDTGTGSGFVLNDEGFVATNHHVVADSILVRVRQQGTREVPASVEWSSRDLDLAVIRMRGELGGETVATLALSSPDANTDKDVLAVGFPSLSEAMGPAVDPTYNAGEVSRALIVGRWGPNTQELQMVQHNAAIYPGNSGGPLFDVCGRVIGVNTMVIAGESVEGFTISVPGFAWASFIGELARVLEDRQIAFRRTDEPCDVAPVGVDGVSAAEVEDIVESRFREGEGEQAAALQEAHDAFAAGLDDQLEQIQDDAQASSLMTASVVGGVAAVLLVVAAFAFASFRRNVLQAVARAQEGASRLVRPRLSRGTPAPAELSRRPVAYPLRLRIGRGRDMDVVVKSESVSRLHAELVVAGGSGHPEYTLVDRGSTNGTRVLRHGQWRRIRQLVVAPDDRIRFGDFETTPRTLETMVPHAARAQERSPHQRAGGAEHRGPAGGAYGREDSPGSVPVRRNSAGEVVPRRRA